LVTRTLAYHGTHQFTASLELIWEFETTNAFEVAIGETHVVKVLQTLRDSMQLCSLKLGGVRV
jgi:hypothetical protein